MLKRLITTSVLVVLVGAASGADAFTNTSDKRTYLHIQPASGSSGSNAPGRNYMFRLADDTTTRKVIQVTNRGGRRVLRCSNDARASLGRTARPGSPIHGDRFGCSDRCEGLVARG